MKKTIKYLLISIATVFVILVIYANVRTIPLSESVKSIRLATFDLKGLDDKSKAEALQKKIGSAPGVTACTFNAKGNIAAIAFHPDETNQVQLMNLIAVSGACVATPKMFLDGPKCPVDGVFGFWHHLLNTLRFV